MADHRENGLFHARAERRALGGKIDEGKHGQGSPKDVASPPAEPKDSRDSL